MAEMSKLLFPQLTSQEIPYKEALDWLQGSYMGYNKGGYVAPANTAIFSRCRLRGGRYSPLP